MSTVPTRTRATPLRDIFAYAIGDGANSLVMNTFFTFAIAYYTKAMGMSGTHAGLAMGLSLLWDAITDPLMGHVTDNTRSRFGRRHPYMLIGGVLTVMCFYAIWAVPSYFQTPELLFWYLVAVNILLRTASTVFAVPYIALGFEVCTDYNQRTTLQGVREGINMGVNLVGCALLVWSVFLRDRGGVKGETIPANYERMGLTFSVAALAFMLFMVFATRKYAYDSRNRPDVVGNSLHEILGNLKDILFDPYPRMVFLFIAVLFIGVVLLTSFQVFVYLDFMCFAPWEKSLVHGSTMVAAALGALLTAPLVRRLDKKPSVLILVLVGCLGNVGLVVLFATGWVPRDLTWHTVPVATLVFLVLHDLYHLGATAARTIATSMMADVSEISRHRTGRLRDGSYSAMLSFVLKASIAIGLVLFGLSLDWLGFDPAREQQTPQVARNLLVAGFLAATVISLLATLTIVRYPVNRAYMAEIQAALASKQEPTPSAETASAAEPGPGPPPEGS